MLMLDTICANVIINLHWSYVYGTIFIYFLLVADDWYTRDPGIRPCAKIFKIMRTDFAGCAQNPSFYVIICPLDYLKIALTKALTC